MVWIGIYLVSVVISYFTTRLWHQSFRVSPNVIDVLLTITPIVNIPITIVSLVQIWTSDNKEWVRRFFFLDK